MASLAPLSQRSSKYAHSQLPFKWVCGKGIVLFLFHLLSTYCQVSCCQSFQLSLPTEEGQSHHTGKLSAAILPKLKSFLIFHPPCFRTWLYSWKFSAHLCLKSFSCPFLFVRHCLKTLWSIFFMLGSWMLLWFFIFFGYFVHSGKGTAAQPKPV